MGKKINSNLFRQLSIFSCLENSSKFFLIQKRFLHEIEVRWFLSNVFPQKNLDLQQIGFEQSFSKGFLVRLDFISLSNIVFFSLNRTSKLPRKKIMSKFKILHLKNLFSSFSGMKFKIPKTRQGIFNGREKILKSYSLSSTIKTFKIVGVSSVPFFLSNRDFREFLQLVCRLLQKFKHLDNFFSLVLITTLSLSFSGFLSLFLISLIKIFFKSRRHSVRLKFLRSLVSIIFKNNRSFSRISGFLMQIVGRLDKRPRAESYKISLGKIQRQSLRGILISKNYQAITKNGTFGIYICFRSIN